MDKISQYGSNFQLKTLRALVDDFEFLQQIIDILKPDYYETDSSKWVVKKIIKYFNEYKSTPTLDYFKIEVDKEQNDVFQVSIKETIKKIYQTNVSDREYIKKTFLDFCKNQTLKNALLNSVDLLEAGDYDSIRFLIDGALKAGIIRDVGHDYIKEIERRYQIENRLTIETPWDVINNLLQGGLGQKNLGIVVGGPGTGKSWTLVALAGQAVKLGYNVVYYSLELEEIYVGRRFDAFFTGISVADVDKPENRSKIEEVTENLPGNLIIKEYGSGGANINTLYSHLDKLKGMGVDVDMVIVDYADLMSTNAFKEKRDKLGDIYTNLRQLSFDHKVPVWTASQANRSAAEEEIVEGHRISESYEKLMIADFVFSWARKAKDKENNSGRCHIIKNRYGPDGITYSGTLDLSKGWITIGGKKGYVDEEEEVDIKTLMQNIYKNSNSD